MKAKRYNSGKLRFGLIPTEALEELALVYTKGAHKYTVYEDENGKKYDGKNITLEDSKTLKIVEDGANNWRLGQNWKSSIESVKRHIHAWENGEDIDEELGTKHLANAAWGLFSILTYYKIFPQGDDRPRYFPNIKIGYDIDGVLADFNAYFHSYLDIDRENKEVYHWNDPFILANFSRIESDEKFWLNIPPLNKPENIYFEPVAYITSRTINPETSKKWLDKHHFPSAKVYSTKEYSKLELCKQLGIDFFIDDSYENFCDLNNGGVKCFLYSQSYNLKYNVGDLRVGGLSELKNKILR